MTTNKTRFSKTAVATYAREQSVRLQKENDFDRNDGTIQLQRRLRGRVNRIKAGLSHELGGELEAILNDLEKSSFAYGQKAALMNLMRAFDLFDVYAKEHKS